MSGGLIDAGDVEVADGVGEVDAIEEVEELGTELDVPGFTKREAFDDGEVHVRFRLSGVSPRTDLLNGN